MTLGLLPILVCTIGCTWLTDSYVLYICSLLTFVYFMYEYYRREEIYSRLILFNSTVVLLICSLIKLTQADWLLPEKSTPITIEVLLFCFSVLFLVAPRIYKHISKTLYPKNSVLNRWGCQSIVIACLLHLLTSLVIGVFGDINSEKMVYTLTTLAPTFVIIASIIFNYFTVIVLGENVKKQVLLRIAPIYNGKIYLTPIHIPLLEESFLDLPISETLSVRMKEINQCAENVCLKYQEAFSTKNSPRFSLKYISKNDGKESTVLLYIIPLKSETEICFEEGVFVDPKEILEDTKKFSPALVEEAEHLQTTTEMWKLFG
ncbi:MAG: hypothetical protein ACRC3Z_09345 [Phocaeicola sp.]